MAIALLGRTRGNRGELTALALSSKPERYQTAREVYSCSVQPKARVNAPGAIPIGNGVRGGIHVVSPGNAHLSFRGVDTISDAERLTGCEVRVPLSERVPLEPGEFFTSDLVGCEVVDRRTGESLGQVSDWLDSGGPGHCWWWEGIC